MTVTEEDIRRRLGEDSAWEFKWCVIRAPENDAVRAEAAGCTS